MKRHVQQPGVRQWAGEDLIELQSEPLKALDGFFSEYGSCIIQGCQITDNGSDTYNISAGLLALAGADVNGNSSFKVVPFSGVTDVPLPVYFKLAYSTVERSYLDGQVKPIAYNYRAEVSTVRPEGAHLELSEDSVIRFVDVIQCDPLHRFFSDAERLKLQGIAAGANNYMHPASHPASMITEAANKRFMTDAERSALSSLGTNAIQLVSQSLWSESTKDAYIKLSNGMLIQWGHSPDSGANKRIYMPMSFIDINYSLLTNTIVNKDAAVVFSIHIRQKYVSSFLIKHRYHDASGVAGDANDAFNWFAIGRWK